MQRDSSELNKFSKYHFMEKKGSKATAENLGKEIFFFSLIK